MCLCMRIAINRYEKSVGFSSTYLYDRSRIRKCDFWYSLLYPTNGQWSDIRHVQIYPICICVGLADTTLKVSFVKTKTLGIPTSLRKKNTVSLGLTIDQNNAYSSQLTLASPYMTQLTIDKIRDTHHVISQAK